MNTYSQTQINALIAAGIDLNEFFGADTTTAPAQPATVTPKVDGRNHEARKHNHDARMARRTAPKNARNAKGLTSAEKSALYRAYPELQGMTATARAKGWSNVVAAFKASGMTVEEFTAQHDAA